MLDTVEKVLALRKTPLFASLPAEDLLSVASLCTERTLDIGDVLFALGEPGDAMYIIIHGAMNIDRGDLRLTVLGAGECVGELAAFDWEPHSATATATEPCLLLRLDRHDLLDLLADHAELARRLAMVLAARIRGMSPHR